MCVTDTVIKELLGKMRAGQQREQRCLREKGMKMF